MESLKHFYFENENHLLTIKVLTPGAVRGFDTHRAVRGGGTYCPPPDISKSTYAFGSESGLVLDRSKKGEQTKKQSEKLRGSVQI